VLFPTPTFEISGSKFLAPAIPNWSPAWKAARAWQQEEEAFLNNPATVFNCGHYQVLRTIQQRVGLEYFGINCGLAYSRSLVVLEVNASMLLHERNEEFPYKDPFVVASIWRFCENSPAPALPEIGRVGPTQAKDGATRGAPNAQGTPGSSADRSTSRAVGTKEGGGAFIRRAADQ
jgi:hypothetical protein